MRNLFRDGETSGAFTGSSPHPGLLWALETLAWKPEYLSRCCLILARLAEVDPGGRLANRPLNTLRETLLEWHPQTAAPVQGRIAALDAIRWRHPELGWQVLAKLMPGNQSSAEDNHRPQWYECATDPNWRPSGVERGEMIDAIVQRALEDADNVGTRWAT